MFMQETCSSTLVMLDIKEKFSDGQLRPCSVLHIPEDQLNVLERHFPSFAVIYIYNSAQTTQLIEIMSRVET